MKRLVLSACVLASAAPAFAISKIYSPDPGKWLNVTNAITLDASVASTNSYGSSDYNHTNALDRTAFTAYLAIWSGYADREFSNGNWGASDKIEIRDAALRRRYEVSDGSHLTLQEIMGDMRSLGDTSDSSSFFDSFYSTPDQFGFTYMVDLNAWICMAAMCDIDTDGSIFTKDSTASLLWAQMAQDVCFNEYSPYGQTLTDRLYTFWNNAPKLSDTFEIIVSSAFADYYTIYEITNTTSVLLRKPLSATSQAMALRDAVFRDTGSEYLFYTQKVDTAYSFSGTAESDTLNVRMERDGSLTIVSPPAHASCGEIEGIVTTNNMVTALAEGMLNEPLRVSSCRANAGLSGYGNLAEVSASLETVDVINWMRAAIETNIVLLITVESRVNGTSLEMNFTIHSHLQGTRDFEGFAYRSFDDKIGTVFQIPTTAHVSSSYSISRGKEGAVDFTPSSSYLGWTYFLASYAVNTNPPPIDECIDFGYQGTAPKPSADMSRASWSYAGFGPYYHSSSDYKSQIANRLRTMTATLRGQQTLAAKSSVGDFENAEAWLGYSDASDWVEEIDSFIASCESGTYTNQINISYVDGEYFPRTISPSGYASIRVSGYRSHGTDELHPSVGANAKIKGMTKQRLEPCAIRRQD